ncbi:MULTISPECIES: TetR/AcrR family transcriptional regulator [Streptomyces]|uniref:TetR/AcrR family transcriptional regulator n=1 Tax=Streptomyces TaxID=1883 RepID=UPI0006AFCEEC|nr:MULTISPECIES: TetR/AcrR family transcriptional regulator [unclassified Streptomyces]KOU91200.1 TetR family transcriptional regulator [Streptomyces sp. XY533]RST06408.1 TetR/AcrR family transcriptional regulator [Streptomyces sp. WAC05950]
MDQERPLRERLIDVGAELVMSEGTGALGLREIARRAGVSHGAPRRYFPTHHSLLSAIARRGFADLGERFAEVAAGARESTPRERVRAIGCAYVGYALEHPGMFELMFRHDLLDSAGQDPSDEPRLRESTLPLFALLVALVGRCGAAEPSVTAAALWANLHGVAQLWRWGSLPLVLGEDRAAGVERLVEAAVGAHLGGVPA